MGQGVLPISAKEGQKIGKIPNVTMQSSLERKGSVSRGV
jgi:hypothetical protein